MSIAMLAEPIYGLEKRREALKLALLPEDGQRLLAKGMLPSYLAEMYPVTDIVDACDQLIAMLSRTPTRTPEDVGRLFDLLSTETDRYALIRGRWLLYREMSDGEDQPTFAIQNQVIAAIGPRTDWYGSRTAGDMYMYLTQNAEFIAWWLVEQSVLEERLDNAMHDQIGFWFATQRILARGV